MTHLRVGVVDFDFKWWGRGLGVEVFSRLLSKWSICLHEVDDGEFVGAHVVGSCLSIWGLLVSKMQVQSLQTLDLELPFIEVLTIQSGKRCSSCFLITQKLKSLFYFTQDSLVGEKSWREKVIS